MRFCNNSLGGRGGETARRSSTAEQEGQRVGRGRCTRSWKVRGREGRDARASRREGLRGGRGGSGRSRLRVRLATSRRVRGLGGVNAPRPGRSEGIEGRDAGASRREGLRGGRGGCGRSRMRLGRLPGASERPLSGFPGLSWALLGLPGVLELLGPLLALPGGFRGASGAPRISRGLARGSRALPGRLPGAVGLSAPPGSSRELPGWFPSPPGVPGLSHGESRGSPGAPRVSPGKAGEGRPGRRPGAPPGRFSWTSSLRRPKSLRM